MRTRHKHMQVLESSLYYDQWSNQVQDIQEFGANEGVYHA